MKRAKFLILMLCSLLMLVFAGCAAPAETGAVDTWDCTVFCAEASEENAYIITYSDAEITSQTGTLMAENQNEFPIVVHISTVGEKEKTLNLEPGEVRYFQNVIQNQSYQIGIHADVKADTEIKVRLHDGK